MKRMSNLKLTDLPQARDAHIPLSLLYDKQFREISYAAVFLYTLLYNRFNLSLRHCDKFSDSEGLFIFFRQVELVEIMGCSRRQINSYMNELKKVGLIVVEPRGKKLPAKIRLQKIEPSEEFLRKFFVESDVKNPAENSGDVKNLAQHNGGDVKNLAHPYENKELIENKEQSLLTYKSTDDTKNFHKPRFMKPTIEEVQSYISEKNYHFDAEEFWNHYENCEWEIGRTGKKMKNWKLACKTWENNQLRFNKRNNSKRSPIASPRPNKNEGFHVEEM